MNVSMVRCCSYELWAGAPNVRLSRSPTLRALAERLCPRTRGRIRSERCKPIERLKAIHALRRWILRLLACRYNRQAAGKKGFIMKNTLIAAALAATMAAGPLASPALADGKASTRNIILGGAAAVAGGVMLTNYNHKKRLKREEDAARTRRQASYRQRFYRTHGYYPQ